MGVATATAIALGVAAVGSGYQIYKGEQQQDEASKAAADISAKLAGVTEANQFQDLEIPTLGLDMAQENIQARQQAEIQGLREAGAAGLLGGLTASSENARKADLELAAEAQKAQYQRDLMVKQNAQQLESNRAQRQFGMYGNELAGAQTARAEGAALSGAGLSGLINVGMQGASLGMGGLGGGGSAGLSSADAAAAKSLKAQNVTGYKNAADKMLEYNISAPKPIIG
jgi:hypothetical protein